MKKDQFKSILKRYTSFSGRLGRLQFLIMNIRTYIVYTLFFIAVFLTSYIWDKLSLVLFLIMYSTLSYVCAALSVRRLHDLNLSGWWLVIFIPMAFYSQDLLEATPDGIAMIIALIIFLISFICMCLFYFKKGSKEENKYGPPPV